MRIEGWGKIVKGGTDPAIGSAAGDFAGGSGEIVTEQAGIQTARDGLFIELRRLPYPAFLFQQVTEIGVGELELGAEIERALKRLLSFSYTAEKLQGLAPV